MRRLVLVALAACSRPPAQCEEIVRVAETAPRIDTRPDSLLESAQIAEKEAGRIEALVIREPVVKTAALELAGELRTLAAGLRQRIQVTTRTQSLSARAATLGSRSDAARMAIDGAKARITAACKTTTPECKTVEDTLAALPKEAAAAALEAFADKLAKLDARSLGDDVRAIEKGLREDAATLREIDKLTTELADHKKDADAMAWLDHAREPVERAANKAREACR
jgi:hypothetical protein